MTDVNLKRLIGRRPLGTVVSDVMRLAGAGATLCDSQGRVLLGSAAADGPGHPVRAGGKPIGRIFGAGVTAALAAALSALCDQELERRALAAETLERYTEIAMVYELAERVAACLEPAEVARLVIETVRRCIAADRVAILLLNEATGLLVDLAPAGKAAPEQGMALEPGQGIAGSVFMTGTAEIVNDVAADPRADRGTSAQPSLMCAPFTVQDTRIGVITVGSTRPREYTAGDLKVLVAVAAIAGGALEGARLHETLQSKTDSLEEVNQALKVLLQKRSHDRHLLEENILSNMKKLVLPWMDRLEAVCTTPEQQTSAALVRSCLSEITSPFSRTLTSATCDFTRAELQVAACIRGGMNSGAIADRLQVTRRTVEFHRRNIRRKLGLQHTKTNLKAYLATLTQ